MQYNIIRYNMELRIKEILKEKRVTAVSLASSLRMAQPSVSNIVNGKVMPSVDTLERIADALAVPITELFTQPDTSVIICPNCGAKLEVKAKE